jgi:hypothetical protein
VALAARQDISLTTNMETLVKNNTHNIPTNKGKSVLTSCSRPLGSFFIVIKK